MFVFFCSCSPVRVLVIQVQNCYIERNCSTQRPSPSGKRFKYDYSVLHGRQTHTHSGLEKWYFQLDYFEILAIVEYLGTEQKIGLIVADITRHNEFELMILVSFIQNSLWSTHIQQRERKI